MHHFYLDDKQLDKLGKWLEDHFHVCKYYVKHDDGFEELYVGAIGGALTYSFTPTSVGTAVRVKCACGAEVNLTDYESW